MSETYEARREREADLDWLRSRWDGIRFESELDSEQVTRIEKIIQRHDLECRLGYSPGGQEPMLEIFSPRPQRNLVLIILARRIPLPGSTREVAWQNAQDVFQKLSQSKKEAHLLEDVKNG